MGGWVGLLARSPAPTVLFGLGIAPTYAEIGRKTVAGQRHRDHPKPVGHALPSDADGSYTMRRDSRR